MNEIVIYTCLAGDYDLLEQPLIIRSNFDYICFSNELKVEQIGVWKIIPIPYSNPDKGILSRFVKINPHLVLLDYKYSIYMDANMKITGDGFYDRIYELIEMNVLWASVKHPLRDCIYRDALQCLLDNRDSTLKILKHVSFIKKNKYPERHGLYENGLIFRTHHAPVVKKIDEEWWRLFISYTKRDQLSLGYIFWKNDFKPDYFFSEEFKIRENDYIQYKLHLKNNRTIPKRIFLRLKVLFKFYYILLLKVV